METPSLTYVDVRETDSTNRYLRTLCNEKKAEEGLVVSAGFQTAGRGQTGNHWESEENKNLLFSLLLRPVHIPADRPFRISQIVSLGIVKALSRYTDGISIKWPNDIYWKEKKITGILIENDLCGKQIFTSIAGIGININQTLFRSSAPNPVSLAQITGRQYDRETLLAEVCNEIMTLYLKDRQSALAGLGDDYRNHLFRKEGFHLYEANQEKFSAAIDTVLDTGHLVLKTPQGIRRTFAFKEVSFLL